QHRAEHPCAASPASRNRDRVSRGAVLHLPLHAPEECLMARLSVEDLVFAYRDREVLSGVSFSVVAGEILGLVGPNGCGKTTLIRCVDGMLTPQEGRVMLEGQDLRGMHRREVAREMAYVPQSAGNQTASTVFETVLMGRRPYLNWTV